jgi:hypothetical protein
MSEDLDKDIMNMPNKLLHIYEHERGSIEIRELIQPVLIQGYFELEEHRYFQVINIGSNKLFGGTRHYKQDAFTSSRKQAIFYQLGKIKEVGRNDD